MGCMLGYIMNHESTNDKKWCKNSQQDGSCMGRKMGEKAIRVLLCHQCRSHDKPRGGWSPMLPWCGFCLQIWQPQIGQICKNHMLKPSKMGCMSRPWGIVHRGENSDSKTWPKTKKKKHQTPWSLREFCREFSWNSWLSLIHFWLPKSLQKHVSGLIRPSAPSMRRKICASHSGSHATHTPTEPLSWKKSNGLENNCPMRIAAGNSSSQPPFLNGVPWQEMGRAKSAEPKHHIQFQTSGFRKKIFRAWCSLEVENVLREQESHVFFDAPRAPSLGMEHRFNHQDVVIHY